MEAIVGSWWLGVLWSMHHRAFMCKPTTAWTHASSGKGCPLTLPRGGIKITISKKRLSNGEKNITMENNNHLAGENLFIPYKVFKRWLNMREKSWFEHFKDKCFLFRDNPATVIQLSLASKLPQRACDLYCCKPLLEDQTCMWVLNCSSTWEPLYVKAWDESSKMHYCLNHLVGGLKFLPCQMGPPGGQKGLIFGPILILLCCVGFLHCCLKQVGKNQWHPL